MCLLNLNHHSTSLPLYTLSVKKESVPVRPPIQPPAAGSFGSSVSRRPVEPPAAPVAAKPATPSRVVPSRGVPPGPPATPAKPKPSFPPPIALNTSPSFPAAPSPGKTCYVELPVHYSK